MTLKLDNPESPQLQILTTPNLDAPNPNDPKSQPVATPIHELRDVSI